MDMKALFKVQCGLFITGTELDGKLNACVTNTLMQQSHTPVKFSITMQKSNYTHDMILKKKSLAVSVVSEQVTEALIKRFGFASGRDTEKFANFPHGLDQNGNPLLSGEEISANISLSVYDTVDIGTHTLFLCTAVDLMDLPHASITYSRYQEVLRNKIKNN